MKRHGEGMLWAVSLLSLIVAAMTTTKAYLGYRCRVGRIVGHCDSTPFLQSLATMG